MRKKTGSQTNVNKKEVNMRIGKFLGMGLLGASFFFLAGSAHPKEIPSAMTQAEMETYLSGSPVDELLPAETYGYPSPLLVMERGGELALTAEQRNKVGALADRMQKEAALYGKKIIAQELLLDDFFRKGQTDPMALANRVESIGLLRWRLRFNMLSICVNTRSALTGEQLQKYHELRSRSLRGGDPK